MIIKDIKTSYCGIFTIFSRYWQAYGGIRALILSPYLHISLLLTALMNPLWMKPGWWDIAISIAPSILGFSLAGYSIWLALGDDKFRRLISTPDEDDPKSPTPFMEVNAAFVHFMLMQVFSLIYALVAKSHMGEMIKLSGVTLPVSAVGFTLLIYSTLCILAATFAILRVSSWYEAFIKATLDKE